MYPHKFGKQVYPSLKVYIYYYGQYDRQNLRWTYSQGGMYGEQL